MLLMEILTITRDRECVSLNCHRHKYAEILPAAFHTFDLSARGQTTITCDPGLSPATPPLSPSHPPQCPSRSLGLFSSPERFEEQPLPFVFRETTSRPCFAPSCTHVSMISTILTKWSMFQGLFASLIVQPKKEKNIHRTYARCRRESLSNYSTKERYADKPIVFNRVVL